MATAQTPAQWAEFITKAETEQTAQQQRSQQILSGSYSDAEKQAAVHDYMLQSDYLSWVKSKYAEYSQTGVLPADMTYSCNLFGNVYRYYKEGSTTEYEYKLLELGIPPYADTNEHEIAHMQPSEVRTFDLIKSPDLTLQLKVTAGSWDDPIIKYKYETGNYPGFTILTDNYQRTTFEILASGRWATDVSYAPSSSTDSNRNYYKIGYGWGAGFTWIPTWGRWTAAFWGPESYTPSGSDNTNDIVAQQVTSVQKSGTVDTPWDFYNDSILPDVDPDDAFFPNGYEPPEPYMEWHEVLTYDISCYKDAADGTKIKLEFKQPVEKNGNPLKTTTIIFSENENNWAGTVTETPEASEGEIKITPFYLGECLSRRCNNEQ